MLDGKKIDVNEALQLRDQARQRASRPNFRCMECEEPVRAHKAGGGAEAHFEHYRRNRNCRLSDTGR